MEQYEYLKTMNIVSPDWDHRAAAYPFAAIPARIVLENKGWTEAAISNRPEIEEAKAFVGQTES